MRGNVYSADHFDVMLFILVFWISAIKPLVHVMFIAHYNSCYMLLFIIYSTRPDLASLSLCYLARLCSSLDARQFSSRLEEWPTPRVVARVVVIVCLHYDFLLRWVMGQ